MESRAQSFFGQGENGDSKIQNREWKRPGNEQLAKTEAPKFLYLLTYLTSKLVTNSSKNQIGKGWSQQESYTGQLRTSGSVSPCLENCQLSWHRKNQAAISALTEVPPGNLVLSSKFWEFSSFPLSI